QRNRTRSEGDETVMSELSLVVKATVIVAIGLGTAAIARRARASVRHVLLASTFIALLLLPLTALLVPQISVPLPIRPVQQVVAPAALPSAQMQANAGASAAGPSWAAVPPAWIPSGAVIVRGVWAAGALGLLIYLG